MVAITVVVMDPNGDVFTGNISQFSYGQTTIVTVFVETTLASYSELMQFLTENASGRQAKIAPKSNSPNQMKAPGGSTKIGLPLFYGEKRLNPVFTTLHLKFATVRFLKASSRGPNTIFEP